ncbi:MAG: M48 family metalloprotease [Ignisphaera sp.]|uniref:Peptidase M48 domain-containing protein n=1 Tax=Ignisphaera aggregans TaxID=334771 RepID=A0A7J3MX69_9CREN
MKKLMNNIEKILLRVWWLYSYEVKNPVLSNISIEVASTLNVRPFEKIKISEKFPLINAAVVGLRCRTIVLTQTLLELMSAEELKAVFLHEYAHCKQKHQVKLLTVALLILILMMLPTSLIFLNIENELIAILLLVLMTCTAYIVMLSIIRYLTRRFEFEADLVAVEAFRDPAIYINMLKKLKIFDVEPSRKNLMNIFRSHPYVEERINRIIETFTKHV